MLINIAENDEISDSGSRVIKICLSPKNLERSKICQRP